MRLRPSVSLPAVAVLALVGLVLSAARPAPALEAPVGPGSEAGPNSGLVLVTFAAAAAGPDSTTDPSTDTILSFSAAGGTAPSIRAARQRAHAAAGGTVRRHFDGIATDVVEVPDIDRAVASYRTTPGVAAAQPDGRVHSLDVPPDDVYPQQWNLQPVSPQNRGTLDWEPSYPSAVGEGIIVAIVDSGLRLGGGDQPANVRTDLAYDFVDDDAVADDTNGHGTHIAGTIAQRTGNVSGPTGQPSVAGVAPAAQIMPVRVLDGAGGGSVSDAIAGILWAASHGAQVINLSFGGDHAKALCDAVAKASETALVVAASGNQTATGANVAVAYPAACPTALAVGALRYDGSRASYSNAGCELAATAPGGDLSPGGRLFATASARPDPRDAILQETFDPRLPGSPPGLFLQAGTSMAAAHVAGAAAVLLGIDPDLAAVRRVLLATTRDLGAPRADDEFGHGAVDLADAVTALRRGDTAGPADALGYWTVAEDGGIFSFGQADFLGSTGNLRLNAPIVAAARTVTGLGYWLAAADGGVFTFGDAVFHGSAGSLRLARPIVGMAASATGGGYWLVADDGGIFAYGDARFLGSAGGLPLRSPVVAMAATRSGDGYRMVTRDGDIFVYGDAPFVGSTGALRLNRPIVGIAATPTGGGYWLVATDGGIFSFGDAAFLGSTGAVRLNQPIVGMQATCFGRGYWLVAADGGIFTFGSAPFVGSTGSLVLNRPVVDLLLAVDHRIAQG